MTPEDKAMALAIATATLVPMVAAIIHWFSTL